MAGKYQLHIRYILLICLLICLFVTLIVPKHVTEEAFQNFSFAATITSIVLAVVSIVYSFYSSGGIATSIGEMKQVEKNLEEEIRDIPDLKKHVSETIDELKSQIINTIHEDRQASDSKTEEILSSVKEEIANLPSKMLQGDNRQVIDVDDDKFSYSTNSILGNYFLYAIKIAHENSQSFHISKLCPVIWSNGIEYFQGYLVALATSKSKKFSYNGDKSFDEITIETFDAEYFQVKDIKTLIINSTDDQARKVTYTNKMEEIEKFFCNHAMPSDVK